VADRSLEAGERAPEAPLPLDDPARQRCRRERGSRIAETMLPKLRDLDPGEGREGAAAGREVDPRGLGVAIAAQSTEEPRPLAEQAALGPRCVAPDRIDRRPRVDEGVAAGVAPEVGPAPGRPPRAVVIRIGPVRPARLSGADLDRERPLAGDRSLDARQRLGMAARAEEGAGQAGKVARGRLGPALAVGVAAIEVDEEAAE
jgi:hypothetical protein